MKRIIDAMKRTVKNNPKGFQIIKNKEGNPKEIFKKKSNSDGLKLSVGVCANPKSGWFFTKRRYPNPPSLSGKYYLYHTLENTSDEEEEPDYKEGQISQISMVYRHLHSEDWSIKLHYDYEVLTNCRMILEYLKDGDEDVEAFNSMVNLLLENDNVIYALLKKGSWIANNVRGCSITSTDAQKGSVQHQLSEIKSDWFVLEAIEQGENSTFFNESLKDNNFEIIKCHEHYNTLLSSSDLYDDEGNYEQPLS